MSAGIEMLQFRVADDLKRALKTQGVRQAALAARLEVSEAEISDRLSGRRNLTLGSLYEMADLADLAVDVRFRPRPTDDPIPSQGTEPTTTERKS